MDYIISLLEGIITFISPCLLPLLPVYISYFMGGGNNRRRAITNAMGFVLGFSLFFVLLGAFAGTFGRILINHAFWINLIGGAIIVVFGLNYIGILRLSILNRINKPDFSPENPGFFSSFLFGVIFSVGWTPCVGAFLGSALMLAASAQDSLKGVLMLLSFSLGLGIPFMASAILMDRLKSAFNLIKKNYKLINTISGLFLILIGIAMISGLWSSVLSFFSF